MVEKMTKPPQKIPTSTTGRPFKIYPSWYFRLENIPSGNPYLLYQVYMVIQILKISKSL
jgi:hypothetical protein